MAKIKIYNYDFYTWQQRYLTELPFIREDDILYASKARQELLAYGVGESQLAQLAKTGTYETSIELRSPADGLVLARNVSRQKNQPWHRVLSRR